MTVQALADALRAGTAPFILDVRSTAEYVDGHVPGAVSMPYWRLPWQLDRLSRRNVTGEGELLRPRDAVVVYCGHGPRAWMALAVLRGRGYDNLSLLDGHMHAWRRAGLPEERG